jgi:hypothetical protein
MKKIVFLSILFEERAHQLSNRKKLIGQIRVQSAKPSFFICLTAVPALFWFGELFE